MRRLSFISLIFSMLLLTQSPLQSSEKQNRWIMLPNDCKDKQPTTELYPTFRFGLTPRFFSDEAALPFIWEAGSHLERVNASIGFLMCPGHSFKIGGEVLNEQLKYEFPCENKKRWMKQSAIAASYLAGLDFCGMRGLELSARWLDTPNRYFDRHKKSHHHRHHHHDHNRDRHHPHRSHKRCKTCDECHCFKDLLEDLNDKGKDAHRPHEHHHASHHKHDKKLNFFVAGSNSYGFAVGLTTLPWNGAYLSGSAVWDRVDYRYKYRGTKVIQGFGGTITYDQGLCSCFSLALKAEFRKPYSYFEGKLLWNVLFASADMVLGIYGGHTVGKHGLGSSTVAGIEWGFDFGLSGFSGFSSAGLCNDGERSGFVGQNPQYLQWLGRPATYVPQVMALPEQAPKKVKCVSHCGCSCHH